MAVQNVQTDTTHLTCYFRDVQRTHPLTREKERELAACIRKGDLRARNELVTANLRFALDMARRYQGRGLPLEDLISAANIGLLEAARRYDGLSGVRFITYAVWWIRQSVLKALSQDQRLVHLPGHISDLVSKIHRVSGELQQELERLPQIEEIASRLDVSPQAVCHAVCSAQEIHSLDEESGGAVERDRSLMERLEDPEAEQPLDVLDRLGREEEIHRLLNTLKGREAEVIRRYYGLGGTSEDNLAEIGRALHLSRERVRQLKAAALKHLRQQYRSQMLRRFVDGEEECGDPDVS